MKFKKAALETAQLAVSKKRSELAARGIFSDSQMGHEMVAKAAIIAYAEHPKSGLVERRKYDDMVQTALRDNDDARREVDELRNRKDAAYLERNQVVALLARLFPSGIRKTDIEEWDEEWHGCVYIDLPTGQVSWHYHDSHTYLFAGLPPYEGKYDGHTTEEKYERVWQCREGDDAYEQARRQIAALWKALDTFITRVEERPGGSLLGPEADAARAILTDTAKAAEGWVKVPDGWQLTPIDPTREMRKAGAGRPMCGDPEEVAHWKFKAMLTAAPNPEAGEGTG